MVFIRKFTICLAFIACALSNIHAHAQSASSYPSRPITVIVPFPPGGPTDSYARLVALKMQERWGQPVVVENNPGGTGILGNNLVIKAPPNGYTLLFTSNSAHLISALLKNPKPYDSVKDFTPISIALKYPMYLLINPNVPVKTVPEFIAYAKANPGKLNYASQGNGSVSHIGTEIFKQKVGINIVHVPSKGYGAAIADVLSGQVQVFISTPPSLMQHVQSGKLRGLAVTSKKRHPMMPDIPTVAEAGITNFELESWVALYAPSGTPPETVQYLSNSVEKAMNLPETKTRADSAGVELRFLPPVAMTAMLNKEIKETEIAIKAAKITVD